MFTIALTTAPFCLSVPVSHGSVTVRILKLRQLIIFTIHICAVPAVTHVKMFSVEKKKKACHGLMLLTCTICAFEKEEL